jgi:hypothetical protein
MTPKKRTAAFVLTAGAVLSGVTFASYCHFAPGPGALPASPPPPAHSQAAATPSAAPPPPALSAAKVPTALTKAPTRLSLEAYELTPATFASWRDYIAGDARGRLWQRIPWRTTLWDAVADAHAQDRPILLEIHGGNALGRC